MSAGFSVVWSILYSSLLDFYYILDPIILFMEFIIMFSKYLFVYAGQNHWALSEYTKNIYQYTKLMRFRMCYFVFALESVILSLLVPYKEAKNRFSSCYRTTHLAMCLKVNVQQKTRKNLYRENKKQEREILLQEKRVPNDLYPNRFLGTR